MKKITTLLLVLLFVGVIFAVTSSVTSFDGQTNPFNITFTGGENHTYYLPVPLHVYVENVSLEIVGYESTT